MKTYSLKREQILPISIEEAWTFFSTPYNLSKITPPELDFHILSDLDENAPIYNGMLIEYRVRPLLGIPVKWLTKIVAVNAPYQFADTQIEGPYRLWEHTHTFKKVPQGVHMTDVVNYALPLGFLGDIAHKLIVKQKLSDIFDFRKTVLEQHFSQKVTS